ncbi:MAG: amidohydrolase [Desulfobacterales bacterium]|nr:amidohydrolase [Desulfobacterales bacterium]
MLDTLIHSATVVTVDEAFSILRNGAVGVRQGIIERVETPPAGQPLPPAREIIDARGDIVMPGLINAHTHLPMALFRGLADDLPLMTWLHDHIFPAEARHITPASVALGARLACAEMLLGGITTCCDGYFLTEHFAAAVADSGLRAILGQGVIDFPAPGVPDPAQNVAVARAVVEKMRGRYPLVQPSIFCHSPYTCSAATLTAAKQAANDLGMLFQIHAAETRAECAQMEKEHGCGPIEYLGRLGLLDANTLLVHAVWVEADDIRRIARGGARIAHCPESNMKLASGVAPLPDFLAAGIPVGLGTDGCASNNDLDLWGEMDMAAKLHKVQRLNPTAVKAEQVVRMATREGAAAVGLGRRTGSLEPGKRADLIVIDTHQPHWTPLYHPASHLVYVARANDVRHVMIDGRWVVRERSLLTMAVADVMREVNAWKIKR